MKNRLNHQIEPQSQQQLTLTLPIAPCPRSNRHLNRSRRLRRATAWFNHMRNVVDHAPDPVAAQDGVSFSSSSSGLSVRSETSARTEFEKQAA